MGTIDNKKFIMRRVYFIWFLRKALQPTVLKTLVAGAFLWQLTSYISIKNIIVNWPLRGDLLANYKFVESAFVNTESMTVILVVGVGILALWLARDFLLQQHLEGSRKAFARI